MRIDRVVSDLERARSPSVLTRQWCLAGGLIEGSVERRCGPITKDLFGFADHVAFDGKSIYFIQSSSASNRAARVKKVLASEAAAWLCASGAKILVITWQRKPDKLHHGTIVELDESDFVAANEER